MEWVRGDTVGHGSFGTVSLAITRSRSPQIPPLMAVKSCGVTHSASLMNEKLILDEFRDCPEIVRCFGDNFSTENGEKLYNVLLEYASGGALADRVRTSGDRRLPELEVKRYTKSILKGLHFVHKNGYVHCDIKLQNCLLFSSKHAQYPVVKIADFGLAKKAGGKREKAGFELRGTPMYMSPEMVAGGEQESPADIWALGCLVAEMVSGQPVWRYLPESGVGELLMRIGVGDQVPDIPGKLSEEGKDFLGKCFYKDPRKRWTAEMLLDHPFLANNNDDCSTVPSKGTPESSSSSPKDPFDFSNWSSTLSCSITSLESPEQQSDTESRNELNLCCTSPAERLRLLVGDQRPDWSVSDSWVTVR